MTDQEFITRLTAWLDEQIESDTESYQRTKKQGLPRISAFWNGHIAALEMIQSYLESKEVKAYLETLQAQADATTGEGMRE